ncbi:MAG TPA: cell division protein FtsZ [Sulfurivirga caldicuralii]|nr:cell division protein FtsZ [Sulfurivirga caldicuralii]
MRFELREESVRTPGMPVIKVVGLGGGGGNAVEYMVRNRVEGVEFICANTDVQALNSLSVPVRIQLGESGLGAGAKPERGREAAMHNIDAIREHLRDADMVFITAGMGGGTGTGAAPVVAQVAREMGILTVGVVSRPFRFERRAQVAEEGIKALSEHVDSLIVIPNDKLIKVLGGDFVMTKAFDYANEVLHGAVQGIAELITRPGLINVDFEDVRTVMGCKGYALMGVGVATGEDRATAATQKAINNPLLEDVKIEGAKGVLVNVTAGPDLTMQEWDDVGNMIDQLADAQANVIVGTSIDEGMEGELRVTVVATGLESAGEAQAVPSAVRRRAKVEEQPVEPQPAEVLEPAPQPQQVQTPVMDLEPPVPPTAATAQAGLAARRVANGDERADITQFGDGFLDIPTFMRRQAD